MLKMAEELIPRLRVADWLDRAEAAQRQLDAPRPARPAQRRRVGRRPGGGPRRVDPGPGGRAQGGAGHEAGGGAGAVARRRRGGARRRTGRARAAAVVGAAQGRCAVPAGAGPPAGRGDDGVVAAGRWARPVGRPCSRRRRSRRCAPGGAGGPGRAAQRRPDGDGAPARRRCSPRSPPCSGSRCPPARRSPSHCARQHAGRSQEGRPRRSTDRPPKARAEAQAQRRRRGRRRGPAETRRATDGAVELGVTS